MSVHAQVDGIGTLEFPDGTDPGVIQSAVQKMVQTKGAAHPEFNSPKSDKVNPALEVFGPTEAAAQMVTGAAGAVAGGIGGIVQGVANKLDPQPGDMSAADR